MRILTGSEPEGEEEDISTSNDKRTEANLKVRSGKFRYMHHS
jgi:hypothetical protein